MDEFLVAEALALSGHHTPAPSSPAEPGPLGVSPTRRGGERQRIARREPLAELTVPYAVRDIADLVDEVRQL